MAIFSVILPVFFIFFIGFVGQRAIRFPLPELSRLTLYLMTPFLCFDTFYHHPLSMNDAYLFGYTLALFSILILVIHALAPLTKSSSREVCAQVLGGVFMNSGNYGIPVVLLAFGPQGRNIAVLLMVFHGLIINSVGVYYAAKGGSDGIGMRQALGAVVRMPILHGMVLGVLFSTLGIALPENLMVCISMVGNASVPTVMIILGMQLAMISLKRLPGVKMLAATAVKLLVSPLVAFVLALFLPADPMTRQIFVLTAAMPTAANTVLLAIQFKTDPEFVSSVTLISTVLSIITVAGVLALLQGGLI